jgi:polysaccharide pyruvyl transferase WcaK-like protein
MDVSAADRRLRRVRPVTCVGYYGHRNAGDDAFVLAASRLAATEWRRPAWFMTRDLPVGAEGRALVGRGARAGLALTGAAAVSAHVVHFGGSTMQDLSAGRRRLRQMSRWRLTHLQALGISVGPFASVADEHDVAEYLRRFDRVVVRDQDSWTRCQEMGLDATIGLDPALLLPPPEPQGRTGTTRTLGVVVGETGRAKGARAHDPQKRSSNILRILRPLRERAEIRLICLNRDDHVTAQRLLAGLDVPATPSSHDVSVRPYVGDPVGVISAIARCDAVVTVRLHGAVFAYMGGVPFVIADYHEKCRSFADSVQAPQEWVTDSDF